MHFMPHSLTKSVHICHEFWDKEGLTKKQRYILKAFLLFFASSNTIFRFASTRTCCMKPYFFPVSLHGINWQIMGIYCPFFCWLDWLVRPSLHFKTFLNLQDIILLRGEKCASVHCPLMHSSAFFLFSWATWWIISIFAWFLAQHHLFVPEYLQTW